jgi:hypothetical protein
VPVSTANILGTKKFPEGPYVWCSVLYKKKSLKGHMCDVQYFSYNLCFTICTYFIVGIYYPAVLTKESLPVIFLQCYSVSKLAIVNMQWCHTAPSLIITWSHHLLWCHSRYFKY